MAASIITVLRRRQQLGKEVSQSNLRTQMPTSTFSRRRLSRAVKTGDFSSIHSNSFVELNNSAIHIQRVYRGYRTRTLLQEVQRLALTISGKAASEVIEMVKQNVTGWNKLCCHAVFFVLYICMVSLQFSSAVPSNYETHQGLRTKMESVEFDGGSFTDVQSTDDLFSYYDALFNDFYHGDPKFEPEEGACGGEIESLLDCATYTPESGWINPFNQYVGSIVMFQRRRNLGHCEPMSLYQKLHEDIDEPGAKRCELDDGSIDMFPNFNSTGVPEYKKHPFTFDKEINGFAATLDPGVFNLGLTAGADMLEFLRNNKWLDENSQVACILFLVSNENGDGRITYAQLCHDFTIGGVVGNNLIIESATTFTGSRNAAAFILTCIFLMVAVGHMIFNIWYCYRKGWRNSYRHPTIVYGWIQICFQYAVVGAYFRIVRSLAVADISLITPELVLEQPAALLKDFRWIVLQIDEIHQYTISVTLLAMILMVKLLFYMDFNQDLSIVTNTIYGAGKDLFYFGIVFAIILCSYAWVGYLLLGGTSYVFSTFGHSFTQLLFIAVGEFEDTKDSIYGTDLIDSQLTVSVMFLWSYIFLSTLLLLNIFLSIIVDSFVHLQDQKHNSVNITFGSSLYIWAQSLAHNIYFYWIPLIKNCNCCRKKKKDNQSKRISSPAELIQIITRNKNKNQFFDPDADDVVVKLATSQSPLHPNEQTNQGVENGAEQSDQSNMSTQQPSSTSQQPNQTDNIIQIRHNGQLVNHNPRLTTEGKDSENDQLSVSNDVLFQLDNPHVNNNLILEPEEQIRVIHPGQGSPHATSDFNRTDSQTDGLTVESLEEQNMAPVMPDSYNGLLTLLHDTVVNQYLDEECPSKIFDLLTAIETANQPNTTTKQMRRDLSICFDDRITDTLIRMMQTKTREDRLKQNEALSKVLRQNVLDKDDSLYRIQRMLHSLHSKLDARETNRRI